MGEQTLSFKSRPGKLVGWSRAGQGNVGRECRTDARQFYGSPGGSCVKLFKEGRKRVKYKINLL